MSNMPVKDFAKYMIDNMNRATLVNAFNITEKFMSNSYDFIEFLSCVDEYITELINGGKNTTAYYKIAIAGSVARKMIESEEKYNKMMVIDNYIIGVWEALNGSKGT